jgi:HAD superfamily hydrolase (TIGR01509 family)
MPKKYKIKIVIFDLGGVLVHGGYLEFLRHYCLECLTREGSRRILALERQVNLGQISETRFYKDIEKIFGVHLTPQQMHKLIVNRMRVDQALVHEIPRLGKKRVALFTNSIGQMAMEVMHLYHIPIKKLFRKVFISSNLHRAKPDGSAYHYILRKLGVGPRQALMVDDRLVNVQGARKIGMQGIIYKNAKQFRHALKKYEFV